jgi:acyl carrier protein
MTKVELLEEIKETLQRDEDISFDMKLDNIEEWDSLAVISLMSLYDELFSVMTTNADIEQCKTINDLINIVANKING